MTNKNDKHEDEEVTCSFCDKTQFEVDKLISNANVFICDECTELCNDIIEGYADEMNRMLKMRLPTPREINNILNQYVVQQSDAKKILSVAVYNHYKRLKDIYIDLDLEDDPKISKSNVLLIGPSGSGKTLLAETLANIINVPFAIADSTTLTEAGYVGDDVENVIQKLLHSSDYNIEKTQKGIIYLDEIDKICKKNENPSITRDVSGEGVQQALLKLIEGTTASVIPQGSRKHPQQEVFHINTHEILFICGGTFTGLDKILAQRINKTGIGFSAELSNKNTGLEILNYIESEDLIQYGLIPEFVGRLPIISILKTLDEDALVDILTKPKNAITKQYIKLFRLDGVNIKFETNALKLVAKKSKERKTGARGLRSILEKALLETMYRLPSIKRYIKTIIVDSTVIENNSDPILIYKDKK